MDDLGSSSDVFEGNNWAPEAPVERAEIENEEQRKIAGSLPVIQDVLDWLDVNATMYASVDSLGVNETTSDQDARVAILLSKKMKAAFESKKRSFEGQFAKYLKEVADRR